MSVVRRDTTWYQSDPASYRMHKSLTPLAFMDIMAELIRQVRPDLNVALHQGTAIDLDLPCITMELRSRTTISGKHPNVLVDDHRRGRLMRHIFQNAFRFRIYAASQAQAEEEAIRFEHLWVDYKGFIRNSGVDAFAFDKGMGRDLDRDGRVDGAYYATRDYNVTLGEVWREQDIPIRLISLRSYSGYELVTEVVTAPIFQDRGGKLEDIPDWMVSVEQGAYTFIEGIDWILEDDTIIWGMDNPPLPYTVTYYRKTLRGSAEIDLPAVSEAGG